MIATRPLGENGLGMTPAETATELVRIKGMFLFPGDPGHLSRMGSACAKSCSIGKTFSTMCVWWPRCRCTGLTTILTFDTTGFSRFPGIEVIHPAAVTAQAIG